MTDQINRAAAIEEGGWLIHKAGRGWYRPNAHGYTNNPLDAGRFPRKLALWHSHPNGPDGPRDGMTIRHETEVKGALPLPPVRFTREDVEKAARTIDPFGWGQLDTALRPYKENRGAQGITGEQFWYGITWGQHGFRTEDEVRRWFLSERTDGKEGDWPCCVFPVRESLKQAAAILAIFGEVEHG